MASPRHTSFWLSVGRALTLFDQHLTVLAYIIVHTPILVYNYLQSSPSGLGTGINISLNLREKSGLHKGLGEFDAGPVLCLEG